VSTALFPPPPRQVPSSATIRAARRQEGQWPSGVPPLISFWLPLLRYSATGTPCADCLLLEQRFGTRFTAVVSAYSVDFCRRAIQGGDVGGDIQSLTSVDVTALFQPRALWPSDLRDTVSLWMGGDCTYPPTRASKLSKVRSGRLFTNSTSVPASVYTAAAEMAATLTAGDPTDTDDGAVSTRVVIRKRRGASAEPVLSPAGGTQKRTASRS